LARVYVSQNGPPRKTNTLASGRLLHANLTVLKVAFLLKRAITSDSSKLRVHFCPNLSSHYLHLMVVILLFRNLFLVLFFIVLITVRLVIVLFGLRSDNLVIDLGLANTTLRNVYRR
jgi:hypothetical protein